MLRIPVSCLMSRLVGYFSCRRGKRLLMVPYQLALKLAACWQATTYSVKNKFHNLSILALNTTFLSFCSYFWSHQLRGWRSEQYLQIGNYPHSRQRKHSSYFRAPRTIKVHSSHRIIITWMTLTSFLLLSQGAVYRKSADKFPRSREESWIVRCRSTSRKGNNVSLIFDSPAIFNKIFTKGLRRKVDPSGDFGP